MCERTLTIAEGQFFRSLNRNFNDLFRRKHGGKRFWSVATQGQQALAKGGKIPLRRGVKSPSAEIDQLLDSGNLHVIKAEGEYSRYMKLYTEALDLR